MSQTLPWMHLRHQLIMYAATQTFCSRIQFSHVHNVLDLGTHHAHAGPWTVCSKIQFSDVHMMLLDLS